MYKNILVPLDGSPASEHAVPWAIGVAHPDGATIRLVRVHLTPNPVMVGSELISDLALDGAVRDQEEAYLRRKVEQIQAASTGKVTGEMLDGPVSAALVDSVDAYPTDLVVMTTHGRGAMARFWLGSVADTFIRHATIPTLLIRPDETPTDLAQRRTVRHILIPLDGSPLPEQIIEPAVRLGQLEGADYTLLMVLDAVEDIVAIAGQHALEVPAPWQGEYVRAKAEEYLENLAAPLRLRSLRVQTRVIAHGSAPKTIIDYAASNHDPVIAMATRGRSGLSRLVFGSVADKVIRSASTPLLIYHPSS